jgi:hypothetical protein
MLSRNVEVKIYKTIMLPVVLYGRETWWRDEVMVEWRKLHSEELHNLYSSPDIIRQVKANEVGRTCGMYGRGEKSVQGFGGKA